MILIGGGGGVREVGRDSVVGIATRYWVDGTSIESLSGEEIFRTCPDQPWGPPKIATG